MNEILVLDPDPSESRRLVSLLQARGYTAVPLPDLATLTQHLSSAGLLICSASCAGEALTNPMIPVVVVDDAATIRRAVEAIRAGASDYLARDAGEAELTESIERILSGRRARVEIPMIGASERMQALKDGIAKVAPTDTTVLITGESGTGKALVARAIHAGSQRHMAPMVSLNCATVPGDQIENELFGYTGEEGLLAAASGGTLFLDEVGGLPAAAQVRLLQALEQIRNIRLICATHQDLEALVSRGQFRNDLYYRLKVVTLAVPPLRDMGDDLVLLADEILRRTMEELGKKDLHFAEETLEDMRRYPWPGNVRELENAIERAVILSEGGAITTDMLAIEQPKPGSEQSARTTSPDQTIEDYFISFVTAHQDEMTETELAEKLGISRKSLWERRQRLNIPRTRTRKRGRRRDVS